MRGLWMMLCGAALCASTAGACTDLKPDDASQHADAGAGDASQPNVHEQRDGGDEPPSPADGGPDGSSAEPTTGEDPAPVIGAGLQLQCADGTDTCVAGSIVSGGADLDRAGSATLPNGGKVTLTDTGFELGGTTCDAARKVCVTGGIAP